MKLLIKIVVGIVAGLALLIGVVALIGSRLPKDHVASRSILLRRSPQDVYAVVRDFGSAPKWRADVKRIEVEARQDGRVYFREEGSNDTINYELVEDIPAERMVTRIRDTDLGYAGRWTYSFAPENGGTRLTIREDGEVSNVIFRFMSRYVFGHTATIDSYLTSLAKHFGEEAAPQTAAISAERALVIRSSQSPTNGDSREPELTTTQDGRVLLSWIEKVGEKRHALRTATLDQNGWTQVQTISEGDNWFVNWADFPSVIDLKDGSLAAHWLVKSGAGTYAYNVNISRSKDGGQSWTKPIVPHRDGTQTEHGFVSLISLPDGRLGAVWLDGRNMKDMKESDEHAAAAESMTLRYATIDAAGNLSDEAQLDERVCECCQTSAAVTSDGPIAVYRDRSASEVRDIYIVRQVNGSWSTPQPVFADNWQINGCPVNGPAVAAVGRNVVVAWFSSAGDTPRVKITFSQDAGATFSQPIQVDDGENVGRVDTLLLPDGSALVCWLAGNVQGGQIKVRRVQPNGAVGPTAVIAQTDISRSSGFPRMARLGNEVHFAWTEFGKPSRIRTAVADVSGYK